MSPPASAKCWRSSAGSLSLHEAQRRRHTGGGDCDPLSALCCEHLQLAVALAPDVADANRWTADEARTVAQVYVRRARAILSAAKAAAECSAAAALRDCDRAALAVQRLHQMDTDASDGTVEQLKRAIAACRKKAAKLSARAPAPPEDEAEPSDDELFGGQSGRVGGMTAAAQLQCVPGKGRCVVAVTDIPAGALVLRERAYAVAALPDCGAWLCAACCRPLPADWLPCARCSDVNVRYCDRACSTDDWLQCHRFECRNADLYCGFSLSGLDACTGDQLRVGVSLQLRIMWRAAPQQLVDADPAKGPYGERLCKHGADVMYGGDGQTFDLDFASVMSLSGGKEMSDRDGWCENDKPVLNSKEYFEQAGWPASMRLEERRALARRCFDALFEKIGRNSHTVLPLFDRRSALYRRLLAADARAEPLVKGMYPAQSLLNHSCAPNCRSVNDGRVIETRTTTAVRRGDELCACYGPRFGKQVAPARRAKLSAQYKFLCHCVACDDPLYAAMEDTMAAFRCAKCADGACVPRDGCSDASAAIVCTGCGAVQSYTLHTVRRAVADLMQAVEASKAAGGTHQSDTAMVRSLCAAGELLHEHNTVGYQQRIRVADVLLVRRPADALPLLRECLHTAEALFGHGSDECEAAIARIAFATMLAYGEGDERTLSAVRRASAADRSQFGRRLRRHVYAMRFGGNGHRLVDIMRRLD